LGNEDGTLKSRIFTGSHSVEPIAGESEILDARAETEPITELMKPMSYWTSQP
jgi:hypothetical protein